MKLNGEQLKKIAANREAALAKLALKTTVDVSNTLSSSSTNSSLSVKSPGLLPSPSHPRTDSGQKSDHQQKHNPKKLKKIAVLKSRLESVGMVAVVEGGEAVMFQGLPGTYYKNSVWHVPLPSYKTLLAKYKFEEGVPENIVDLFINKFTNGNHIGDGQFNLDSILPEDLISSLFPFQLDGVFWGLGRKGRFILADDMGLGKSLQALAIAAYYRPEWPLLILAPASMVATWTEQVKRWYCLGTGTGASTGSSQSRWIPVEESDLAVAYDGKASLRGLISILSYDLAVRLVEQIKGLKAGVVIADESHCLRNASTKRFKSLAPILKKTGRLILLSGTPALSRPIELFSQLSLVSPKLFPRQLDYGLRYCGGRRDRFGWNFRGASNLKELGIILEETVMLRRCKGDVLGQLPRKLRQQVFVRVPDKELGDLRALAEAISVNEWASLNGLEEAQKKGELMALWRRTGEAKLPAMWSYIIDLLDDGLDDIICDADTNSEDGTATEFSQKKKKILLFAHHQSLMDALETKIVENGIGYIRIDGKTPPSSRHSLCAGFQSDPRVRLAVLSITAASVGLTLTSATLVVFCELFFNPGILVQAEDRAHRIGQTDSVTVKYLLAKGTIDDRLWPLLLSKLNTLESVGLGQNEFTGMARIEHDEKQLKMDKFLL